MATEDLATILGEELSNAANSELQGIQALALAYYDAETGTVGEGMSDLVSPDVRDAIESVMAEIMSAINPDDPMCVFEPETPGDADMASLETRAVHDQIFGRNRGYIILETAIRDAILQRYGIIRVGGDEKAVELAAVAPENFVWSSDLTTPFLADARFHAERVYHTRAQLRDIHARYIEELPENAPTDEGTLQRYSDMIQFMHAAARDEDELIECWYCYLRNNDKGGFDCHLFVDPSHVIKSYYVPHAIYATGVSTIRPHRFDGVSVFDKLQQIQTTKTYMLRQLANQTKLASQQRLAVRDKAVNPDDLVSDALNPVIRTKGLPAEDMMPLPIQDVTSQLLSTLQWMDGIRREDGGASIDMTSPQMQVANQSAHAAERMYSVKEMQTNLMLKTIGETLVRSLYLLVHAKMRDIVREVTVRTDEGYFSGMPAKFPERNNVVIDMGTTLGVRQRRLGAVSEIILHQNNALQTGGSGILVTPKNIFNAQMAYAKLSGLDNAELFWTDPESQEAQQSAAMQAQAAQADRSLEVDAVKEIEKYKGEIQLHLQDMKGQQDRDKAEQQAEIDYLKIILDAQAKGKELDIQEAQLMLSAVQGETETADEASTASE